MRGARLKPGLSLGPWSGVVTCGCWLGLPLMLLVGLLLRAPLPAVAGPLIVVGGVAAFGGLILLMFRLLVSLLHLLLERGTTYRDGSRRMVQIMRAAVVSSVVLFIVGLFWLIPWLLSLARG